MNDPPRSRKQSRQARIIALLRANPSVRIAELAREFAVSTETVRRDLDELNALGAVSRTYGGAARATMGHEAAVNERLTEHTGERQRIGRRACAMVAPGDIVMIDGGSTTIHFAGQLAAEGRDLTALTNSLGVATVLGRNPSFRVVLCPGDYQAFEGIVTGPETLAFLERFSVDKTFIGASGLTEAGPSEVHPGAAWVKRRMLGQAKTRLLLLDSSKFGDLRHELICSLKDVDGLVTDRRPGRPLRAALGRASVSIYLADDPMPAG